MRCPRCGGWKNITCETCGGKGFQEAYSVEKRWCKSCGGNGEVVCPLCGGSGSTDPSTQP